MGIMNSLTDSSRKSSSSNPLTHRVIIALGSNADHEANLNRALSLIGGVVDISSQAPAMWTEPVGKAAGMFLNSMVAGQTSLTLDELTEATKLMEAKCGRSAQGTAAGRIDIDIDILDYDGLRLHPDEWNRSYIKQLMKHI